MDNQFKSHCRVCLVEDSASEMHPLADQTTRKLLFECTSVWVEPGDNLPHQLCTKCWIQFTNWSTFKALAKFSDRKQKGGRKTVEEEEDQEEDLNDFEDGEIVMVKEEPVEYIEGYSLAPEEAEEAADEAVELEVEEHFDSDSLNQPNLDERTTVTPGQNLKSHKLTQVGLKEFKCNNCEKRFMTKSALTKHKLIHTGIRPFECDECCRKFIRKYDLKKHKSLHARIRPFGCDQCDKKFIKSSHLKTHKLSHSKKKK